METYEVPRARHYSMVLTIAEPGRPQGARLLAFIADHGGAASP